MRFNTRNLILSCIGFSYQLSLQSAPLYSTTSFPIHPSFSYDPMYEKVSNVFGNLSIYKDSIDPNQYYYMPRLRPESTRVAASLIVAPGALDAREHLRDEIEINKGYKSLPTTGYYSEVKSLSILEQGLNITRKKLENCAHEDEERLQNKIEYYKREIQRIKDETRKQRKLATAMHLGLAGIGLNPGDLDDEEKYSQTLKTLSNSSAGVFTIQLTAKLYQDEVNAIQHYRKWLDRQGLPKPKLSCLPIIGSLSWEPLAELVQADPQDKNNKKLVPDGTPIFRNLRGGGNLDLATVNADLSYQGALALYTRTAPVMLPIQAKALVLRKFEPLVAHLKCHFKTGWHFHGRTDVKDGALIFSNDIYQNVVATAEAHQGEPCVLTITGGSGEKETRLALEKSMMIVQERLMKGYEERLMLSEMQKTAYFEEMKRSVEAQRQRIQNQRQSSSWITSIVSFGSGSFAGIFPVVEYVSRSFLGSGSQFFWHTDVRHIDDTTEMAFEQKIVLDANERIEESIPAGICVVSNDHFGYVSCTHEQYLEATTLRMEAQKIISENPGKTADEIATDRHLNHPRTPNGDFESDSRPGIED